MKRLLTNKQARFASLVARGQTKSQAYRSAYDAGRMKQTSIKVEANKVSKLPHVAGAIKSLRENHEFMVTPDEDGVGGAPSGDKEWYR